MKSRKCWNRNYNNMERKFVVRCNKSNESCSMIDQVILIKLLIFFKEASCGKCYFCCPWNMKRKKYKMTLYILEMKFLIFCSCCEFLEDFYSTCDLYETNDKQLLQKWWSVVIYRHKLLLINCEFMWPIKLSN